MHCVLTTTLKLWAYSLLDLSPLLIQETSVFANISSWCSTLFCDVVRSVSLFNTVLMFFSMISDHLLQFEERSLVPLVNCQLLWGMRLV